MGDEKPFDARVALLISGLALVLSVASILGSNNDQDVLWNEMEASDTWAFFQAKNIRRQTTLLARDELALTSTMWPEDARAKATAQMAKWESDIARYREEPKEGMSALYDKAKAHEAARDVALRRDPNFDLAEALLQLGIVLASVAIVLKRPIAMRAAVGAGLLGTLCLANGLLLLIG